MSGMTSLQSFWNQPIASTTQDVNKFVNNLLESKNVTKSKFYDENSDATAPRLYGLPKSHK